MNYKGKTMNNQTPTFLHEQQRIIAFFLSLNLSQAKSTPDIHFPPFCHLYASATAKQHCSFQRLTAGNLANINTV